LRSPLPTEFNLSIRSSAYTDRNNPSVFIDGMLRIKKKRVVRWRGGYCGYFVPTESPRDSKKSALYGDETGSPMNMPTESPRDSKRRWRDRFTDEKCRQNHRGIQNGSSVRWRDRFTDEKCRRNHRGIQNGSSVWWRVLFTVRIADGIKDRIGRRWIRRQKLIYPLSLDSILPYFSFFFSFFFLISTLPNCKQPAPLSENISLFLTQQVIYLKVFLSQYPCSDLPMDFYQFL